MVTAHFHPTLRLAQMYIALDVFTLFGLPDDAFVNKAKRRVFKDELLHFCANRTVLNTTMAKDSKM